jgi:hypothetical protein
MKLELKYENLKNGGSQPKLKRGRPRLDCLRSASAANTVSEPRSLNESESKQGVQGI